MCCDAPESALLPPPVAATLADYRALRAARPDDWGDEIAGLALGQAYIRWLGPALFEAFAGADPAWPDAVRRRLAEPDPLPVGLIVAALDARGVRLRRGPLPYAPSGGAVDAAVLLDSRLAAEAAIAVDGASVRVPAGGVALIPLAGATDRPVAVGGAVTPVAERAAAARLRLRARRPSRWSVVDDRGGAWFPDGAPRKWDVHGRPLFHGNDLELDVPAVPLTVACARGMEYAVARATVTPTAGGTTEVALEPALLFDPAARGWYGGDLHVHLNYSGDLVCSPHDAACMQLGEGLHLMNLVAANIATARVYDRAAFETTAGRDLPWSTDARVARFGVEYRNDLLGHFHALGPSRPPRRYFSGYARSDHPVDWPPNAAACAEFHDLGAVVGYAHPVFSPLADGTPAGAGAAPRSTEARELVADAALGLVDAVDLLGPHDAEGAAVLYRHLLNCGLRLAATAGTDVWLSNSRGPLVSNPPGWARVYADLRGAPPSVSAFQAAIRAGRTLATNGPWLELTVDGRGPGDVIAAAPGRALSVAVRADGTGVEELELVGPDGVLARAAAGASRPAALDATLVVAEPSWLCAVARGPGHPAVLGPVAFAHTSPVYVDAGGRPVHRPASARWLLDWLDRCDALVRSLGVFADEAQHADLFAVLERARSYYRARAT